MSMLIFFPCNFLLILVPKGLHWVNISYFLLRSCALISLLVKVTFTIEYACGLKTASRVQRVYNFVHYSAGTSGLDVPFWITPGSVLANNLLVFQK